MPIAKELKKVLTFRDADGKITASKGTVCNLIEDGGKRYVEKQWTAGDWVFSAEYEYQVEKHAYTQCIALNLPVPALLDFDDAQRKLCIEFVPGSRLDTPATDTKHLTAIVEFFDQFRGIGSPPSLSLHGMKDAAVRRYNTDQLQYLFPQDGVWTQIDAVYESFIRDLPQYAIPFDGILKNALLSGDRLFFIDFEWTIQGPYEFALARIAVEFNQYDSPEVMSRVERLISTTSFFFGSTCTVVSRNRCSST